VVPTTYDDTKVGLPHDFEERLAEFFRRWPAHCNTGTYSEQHRCAASIAVDLGLDHAGKLGQVGFRDEKLPQQKPSPQRTHSMDKGMRLQRRGIQRLVASVEIAIPPSFSPAAYGAVECGTETTPLTSLLAVSDLPWPPHFAAPEKHRLHGCRADPGSAMAMRPFT
jgi:hypothetical protein